MLSTTAALFQRAARDRSPLLAFNIITLEHAQAVLAAAEAAGQPVILQISENAARYHRGPAALIAACQVLSRASTSSVSLHLDHVESVALLHLAVDLGVTSVMVDGSRLPDQENIAFTRDAAAWAHRHNLFVEAELGAIGGKGHPHTPGVRTDPAHAAAFVTRTGVDALAVAVGSQHAMTTRTAQLDQPLIRALARAVPVPLVLHGSSGIADDTLRDAIASGIVKVNVGTLLNVAFTRAVRDALSADAGQVDPRRYLGAARAATETAVLRLFRALTPSTAAHLTPNAHTII
jgi:fructose-bisphosphate aldolase class II